MNKLILEGAERLLNKGNINFTIKELASEVPCARSAIYRAFPAGHKGIMMDLLYLAMDELRVATGAWLMSADLNVPRLRDTLVDCQNAYLRHSNVWVVMHSEYIDNYQAALDEFNEAVCNKITVSYPWVVSPMAVAAFCISMDGSAWENFSVGIMKNMPDKHVMLDLIFATWCHHLGISTVNETRLVSSVLN